MATKEKHKQRSMFGYRKSVYLMRAHASRTYGRANGAKERKTIREFFKAMFGKIAKKEKKA